MLHQQRVLVTGGMGYIGSHIGLELMRHGHTVMLLDNVDRPKVREGIARITGRAPAFVAADIRNRIALRSVFEQGDYDAVVHCAALKVLPESLRYPIQYWDSNVSGTLNVLLAMEHASCKRIVFASSAAVYEESSHPLSEIDRVGATNPYGQTKLAVEQVIEAATRAARMKAVTFRIFNPLGADESGLLAEPALESPTGVLQRLLLARQGQGARFVINGKDWPTPDGTCLRDYVHVSDIAKAFRLAVEELHADFGRLPDYLCMNLGSEKSTSIIQLLNEVNELPNGQFIETQFAERRPGDIGRVVSSSRLAYDYLHWHSEKNLSTMVRDAWRVAEKQCVT